MSDDDKPKVSRKNKKAITQKEFNRIMDYLLTQHKMDRMKKAEKATSIAANMAAKRLLKKSQRRKVKLMDVNELVASLIELGEVMMFEDRRKNTGMKRKAVRDHFWRDVAERSVGGVAPVVVGGLILNKLTKGKVVKSAPVAQ